MALGPEERAALKTQIYDQYRQQPESTLYIGLELALRGLEISRKQLDANRLEWDDYVRLKGHYNATAHGVLAAFEERGWTPGVVQLWKRFHGPLWMDLEEPTSLSKYVQEVYAKIVPKLIAPHMALRALNTSLTQWSKNQGDPKSVNISKQSIEAITDAMDKAGHALQVKALKAIHGYDPKPDFAWMSRFVAILASPAVEAPVVVAETPTEPPKKRRGLQKCRPGGDGSFEPPQAADSFIPAAGIPAAVAWEDDAPAPVAQPWEEALDITPGTVPSTPQISKPEPVSAPRPRGLQKCKPDDDIGIDSFGM